MTNFFQLVLGDPQPLRGDWAEGDPHRITFPLQPLNTLSSLSYALGGLVALRLSPDPASVLFLLSAALLTLGTGLYHAWPTPETNRLDHAGMHAVFFGLAGQALLGMVGAAAGIMLGLTILAVWRNLPTTYLMGVTWLVAFVGAGLGSGASIVWALTFFAFLAGMLLWTLDRRRAFTGVWGHAAWHVLTAVGATLLHLLI